MSRGISYAVEPLEDILEELKPLLEEHYEEVAMYKDRVKLDPDYEKYLTLSELGILHCVTVRDKGVLIGYFITFIQPHLHYQETLYGVNDILFLEPSYRGSDVAVKLFMFAEERLRDEGVDVLVLHMKTSLPFEGLAKFLHYDKAEYNYSKYIGEG